MFLFPVLIAALALVLLACLVISLIQRKLMKKALAKKKAHKTGGHDEHPHPHWLIPWTKQFVLALVIAVPSTGIVYLLHIPSVGWQMYLLQWYIGLTLFWCLFTPEWIGKPPTEGGH